MSEQNAPLLAIEDLSVSFPASRRGAPRFIAVDGVSLEIAANQTLGLVGESGSGKSTIGRAMLGLNPVERGSITLEGRELTRLSPAGRREVARTLTAVFQDPYSSLNPALTIGATLTEPLLLERGVRPEQARAAVVAALDRVGMPAETLDRYPRQFSGGQRQRIAIARALVTHPKLVICDEAVSALDLSVQAQVLNLLRQVQRQVGIAMLFITHDLSVVRHVSDQIAVLLQGRIMELGPAEAVCTAPAHPYTQALIAAAPIPDPVAQRRRREVLAELVRPADATTETATVTKSGIPGSGCPFAPRCPRRSDVCFTSRPRLTTVESGVKVACHLATAAEVGL